MEMIEIERYPEISCTLPSQNQLSAGWYLPFWYITRERRCTRTPEHFYKIIECVTNEVFIPGGHR